MKIFIASLNPSFLASNIGLISLLASILGSLAGVFAQGDSGDLTEPQQPQRKSIVCRVMNPEGTSTLECTKPLEKFPSRSTFTAPNSGARSCSCSIHDGRRTIELIGHIVAIHWDAGGEKHPSAIGADTAIAFPLPNKGTGKGLQSPAETIKASDPGFSPASFNGSAANFSQRNLLDYDQNIKPKDSALLDDPNEIPTMIAPNFPDNKGTRD